MNTKPNFLVFSSPYEQEECECPSCFILTELPHEEMLSFIDYLGKNTPLSVNAFMRHEHFLTNIGEYHHCTVIEVHVDNTSFSCEKIAIEQTDRYLLRK